MAGRSRNSSNFTAAGDPTQVRLEQAIQLHQNGRIKEAMPLYERVLLSRPRSFDALHLLGVCLLQSGQAERAVKLISSALRIKDTEPSAHNHLGIALHNLNRTVEAAQSFQRALQLDPMYVDALQNLGVLLLDVNMATSALPCLELAAALHPDGAEIHHQLGNALVAAGRVEEGLQTFDKAISLQPDHAQIWFHRGQALHDCGQLQQAVDSHQRAVEIDPDLPFGLGGLLGSRMQICDWAQLDSGMEQTRARLQSGKQVIHALTALALFDDPPLHSIVAGLTAKKSAAPVLPKHEWQQDRPLRIGYYSADFHNHATAWLMAETFERHDRSRVEIFAFSFGPRTGDAMQQRLQRAFDHFIDVKDLSDSDVAAKSRELQIDIAIDLKGYTQNFRAGLFAVRCAPLQVNYLGYPGTLAADYIDYLLADPVVVPADSVGYYSEKLAWLPGSYQPNDSRRRASDRQFTRSELGLPESGFVFCCFNNSYKITPDVFEQWMALLHAVPGSVLWLLADNAIAAANQQREAAARGIDPYRLVFAPRMSLADHLARHRQADLFLDTCPYGAHTTASDALWMGLPVLTCPGRSFASRVAASLLTTLGLPELIAADTASYQAMGVALARDPQALSALRGKLANARATSSLFDGSSFASNLESAYEAMMSRHAAGLPPDHLRIGA